MCCQFPPYIIPTVWYPLRQHCGCFWGCQCSSCRPNWQLTFTQPAVPFTPSPVEAKIDRLLVLAERGEAERKRQAAVNKRKSHRW
jgi:hypothetical protein